jgi:hypothetical protein
MSLRPCPECRAEISPLASSCPKCGYSFWRRHAAIGASIFGALSSFAGAIIFWVHANRIQSEFGTAPGDELVAFVRHTAIGALIFGIAFTAATILIVRYFHPGKRRPDQPAASLESSGKQ